MKTLTLFRHAKSGWDSPVSRDFDRPLNTRGVRGARLMGAHAASAAMHFDHVLSSPAVRCVETLDGFWDGYGRILHPVWDRRIYLASGVTLLDVVTEIPESATNVLMCGHNPGLEDLALMLVPDHGEPLRDTLEEKYPTAAMATLTFGTLPWSAVKAGRASLTGFIRPRDLDPTLGPEAEAGQ